MVEGKNFIKVVDNRTEKSYEIGLKESRESFFVGSKDFLKIKDKDGIPLRVYDPGYMNTICATSSICYIDGDKGILEYRGIPI